MTSQMPGPVCQCPQNGRAADCPLPAHRAQYEALGPQAQVCGICEGEGCDWCHHLTPPAPPLADAEPSGETPRDGRVERVARAMFDADDWHPDLWDAPNWEGTEDYRRRACAALAALSADFEETADRLEYLSNLARASLAARSETAR